MPSLVGDPEGGPLRSLEGHQDPLHLLRTEIIKRKPKSLCNRLADTSSQTQSMCAFWFVYSYCLCILILSSANLSNPNELPPCPVNVPLAPVSRPHPGDQTSPRNGCVLFLFAKYSKTCVYSYFWCVFLKRGLCKISAGYFPHIKK